MLVIGGELAGGGDVDDEGVPGGTLLGEEDSGDGGLRRGRWRRGRRRFRWRRRRAALAEERGGAGDVGGVGGVEMHCVRHAAVSMVRDSGE